MKERTEIAVIFINGLICNDGFWEVPDTEDRYLRQRMIEDSFELADMVIHFAAEGNFDNYQEPAEEVTEEPAEEDPK